MNMSTKIRVSRRVEFKKSLTLQIDVEFPETIDIKTMDDVLRNSLITAKDVFKTGDYNE